MPPLSLFGVHDRGEAPLVRSEFQQRVSFGEDGVELFVPGVEVLGGDEVLQLVQSVARVEEEPLLVPVLQWGIFGGR